MAPGWQETYRRQTRRDRLLRVILITLAVITATIVVWIAAFLVQESLPLLTSKRWTELFTNDGWYPQSRQFQISAMLAGSLLVTLGATAIAVPVGLLSALYMRYYAPRLLAQVYRRLLELLAGIPSVVFGFWGLVALVPLINQWHPPGASLLAAILVLGLMILPLTALSTDAALAQVPAEQWQAAEALGLSRWATISRVALPAAAPGIAVGAILQTGRALGETMAVLMVAGNVVQVPASWFEPVRTLTANIALEMAYAVGDHRSALFVSGLLLMIAAVALAVLALQLQNRNPHVHA